MRILFITAFYPPQVIGGWEQLVQDINVRLQRRGHTTHVLTSTYGLESGHPFSDAEPGVERVLELESDLYNYRFQDFLARKQRLQRNLEAARRSIERFQPDVIFIHVMFNLNRGIAWMAEKLMPGRVVYYVANDWPHAPNPHRAFWEDAARNPGKRMFKRLLAPLALRQVEQEESAFPLKFEHVMCVSQAVRRDLKRQAGIPETNMQVVYNGVETDLFTPALKHSRPADELALVYAGSLAPHKGVHTAVEALAQVDHNGLPVRITLSLVGSGHPDYEAHLHRLVAENRLEDRVFFLGRVPREQMPDLLRRFDVLVFPSIWEEPLARMTQEAMACGLVVVGTPTGGTPEILVEGETGLTFPAGDAAALAKQLERLARDPALRRRLAETGRQVVLQKFDLQRMIDEIEAGLERVAKNLQGNISLRSPQAGLAESG